MGKADGGVDGAREGWLEGVVDGRQDGIRLGCTDGSAEGIALGSLEGSELGFADGATDTRNEGALLGIAVSTEGTEVESVLRSFDNDVAVSVSSDKDSKEECRFEYKTGPTVLPATFTPMLVIKKPVQMSMSLNL